MSSADSQPTSGAARPLSLGVIFLTLYIDLVGFSIAFPLGPDLLAYYLGLEGKTGALGWMVAQVESLASALGIASYAPVLFGGVVASVFSILQFVFAPFWGELSDRRGRRGVLLFTVAGTAASYLLWALSGSFWLFLLARGADGGQHGVDARGDLGHV
ncbi:MAG: MFS transporter, partial [Opitutaceae bacterium]